MDGHTMIITATAISVGIMLSAAALGVTISWGMIASKTLEGIARQPEMKGELMFSTFIFAGLMESFPFIVMAIALWLLTANPLLG